MHRHATGTWNLAKTSQVQESRDNLHTVVNETCSAYTQVARWTLKVVQIHVCKRGHVEESIHESSTALTPGKPIVLQEKQTIVNTWL